MDESSETLNEELDRLKGERGNQFFISTGNGSSGLSVGTMSYLLICVHYPYSPYIQLESILKSRFRVKNGLISTILTRK